MEPMDGQRIRDDLDGGLFQQDDVMGEIHEPAGVMARVEAVLPLQ